MEIKDRQGQTKHIELHHFGALDGWEIQMRFLDFAASQDKAFRRAYVMEVLEYAKLILGENAIPLSTDAVIDNHLQTWENIQLVFEAVLRHNGIDPATHADKPHFWANAGAEMAVAFVSKAVDLLGPALSVMQKQEK